MPLTVAGKTLADTVYESRLAMGLTQAELGRRYDVTGPAIFKFEKGFVRPSLKLWLRIAQDADLTERRAVLMWIQTKVPQEYQQYVDLASSPTDRPRIVAHVPQHDDQTDQGADHAEGRRILADVVEQRLALGVPILDGGSNAVHDLDGPCLACANGALVGQRPKPGQRETPTRHQGASPGRPWS